MPSSCRDRHRDWGPLPILTAFILVACLLTETITSVEASGTPVAQGGPSRRPPHQIRQLQGEANAAQCLEVLLNATEGIVRDPEAVCGKLVSSLDAACPKNMAECKWTCTSWGQGAHARATVMIRWDRHADYRDGMQDLCMVTWSMGCDQCHVQSVPCNCIVPYYDDHAHCAVCDKQNLLSHWSLY